MPDTPQRSLENPLEDWNPDQAGAELNALFKAVDEICSDTSPQRPLTEKEQKVVDTFEVARPGLGAIAQANIQNPNSGWQEIIADMDESEIVCQEGTNSNNGFMYRHIGH